jgi:shikimate dehydrogenase
MVMDATKHIRGTTRLYGLVGDPVATAKSPELLNRLFCEHHVDAVCVPLWVKAGDLSAFVAGARTVRNLSGLLVTMPHKQEMLPFVGELHPTARQVGALNIIRCDDNGRWVGAMFDGAGCVLGMQWENNHPANKSVLLVGAGGAGRAIAFAVASAGARTLTIFEPGSTVVDIITTPDPTPLCRAARERGCRTQGGRPMHEDQAVHALRLGFDYLPEGKSLQDIGLPSQPANDAAPLKPKF